MTKHPAKTLIVVADSARARFFRPEAGKLVAAGLSDLVAPLGRLRSRALATDKPGRSFGSAGGGARHALEPPHDYRKLQKRHFLAVVATTLDAALERREFDQLVLVAPRRSLGELRGMLSRRVQECVCEEVAKDLTKEPASRLRVRLGPVLGARLASPPRPA